MPPACCSHLCGRLLHVRAGGPIDYSQCPALTQPVPPAPLHRPQPELLSALARCADGMLRQFGPQELTNTVWSFSQMFKQGVALPQDVNVRRGSHPALRVHGLG